MASTPSILEQQAFPVLDVPQIARLRAFGTVKDTHPGEVLFDVGECAYSLVVVLEGAADIVDRANADHVLKTSGPGEFNGELGLLTGQSAFTACIISKPGKVLIVPPAGVHEIIATIPDLSNILVTAFAARRQILMLSAVASLTIIGREEDAEALRLLEFVDRNRIPYRWLDPHNPSDTSAIATCGSPEGDTFRVVLDRRRTLERPSPLDLARAIGLDLFRQEGTPSDLIVVGAGPAGLSAAVYGASEGLSTADCHGTHNACAALNFLDRQPPDLDEVREALGCVVGDADRAGDIIDRIRDHIKKVPPRKDRFDLNKAINEVSVLAQGAITKNRVSVQTRLTEGLFPVEGDRV